MSRQVSNDKRLLDNFNVKLNSKTVSVLPSLDAYLIFCFRLLPLFRCTHTGFPFALFLGFLAIFILLSSNNNTLPDFYYYYIITSDNIFRFIINRKYNKICTKFSDIPAVSEDLSFHNK